MVLMNVSIRATQEYSDSLLSVIWEGPDQRDIDISNPPLWHEYRNLYTLHNGIITRWREREAHKLYQAIRRCNDETFIYRLADF